MQLSLLCAFLFKREEQMKDGGKKSSNGQSQNQKASQYLVSIGIGGGTSRALAIMRKILSGEKQHDLERKRTFFVKLSQKNRGISPISGTANLEKEVSKSFKNIQG